MSMISSGVLIDINNDRNTGMVGGCNKNNQANSELSPSIQLLLRFQRLLVSHLLLIEENSETKQVTEGILCLLYYIIYF